MTSGLHSPLTSWQRPLLFCALSLIVMSGDVVESAEGRAADRGVVSVMIVEVQPGRKCRSTFGL